MLIDAWQGSGLDVGAALAIAGAMSVAATAAAPSPEMAITCENVRISAPVQNCGKYFSLKVHALLWIRIDFERRAAMPGVRRGLLAEVEVEAVPRGAARCGATRVGEAGITVAPGCAGAGIGESRQCHTSEQPRSGSSLSRSRGSAAWA